MSSSKSKRFVSVFDRLGPGTDEADSGGGSSRRFSTEKHQSPGDKPSRHSGSYPLSSPGPEQLAPRERKTSGQSDDKKHQLHYREAGRPRPLDHPLDSDSDERLERRKLPTKGHKSGGTKQRGGGKHRATSSDTSDTDSGREGNKQQKRDSESLRQSKNTSEVEVKRRYHDRKDKPSGGTPLEVKGRSHGKDMATPHEIGGHKRRKEESYSEPRYGDRKRKHDDDPSPYDYKKPRLSDAPLQSPHRVKGELLEHKRRHEPSPRERRHPRSHTPETTPTVTKISDPLKNKVDKRIKKTSSSLDMEVVAETPETPKALNWNYLNSYTQRQTAKLDHSKPRSALERFTPGALFARVGLSLSLAGPDYYHVISSAVSTHLQQEGDPFRAADFAALGLTRVREGRETVFQTGECRRALTAADDLLIRRKLRKQNQSEFLPRLDSLASWESQDYSTAVSLYNSLGKKLSGKPAYRVQDSSVGELLVAR